MRNENELWVVWQRGGGSPVYEHTHYESAEAEAQRLARTQHGQFIVLRATRGFQRNDIVETDFIDPPF